jgi:hypothetical protein
MEKLEPDAELISPKGENKVSPRRSIGHIAPEPISSPTLTAPSAEVISNSPGSNAKKEEKKQKLKPGEAVALEEKPKLESAQVYSFKELQASGFAFDDENEIVQSDNDSDSYMSDSDGATPRMAQGTRRTPDDAVNFEHYLYHPIFKLMREREERERERVTRWSFKNLYIQKECAPLAHLIALIVLLLLYIFIIVIIYLLSVSIYLYYVPYAVVY